MKDVYLFLLCLLCSVMSVKTFMKLGTSPSSPNAALRNCMRNVGYYKRTQNRYRNKFSNSVWKWCSVHKRVLPCVENSMENNSLRSPSDWFFSMTFDSRMARKTSVAMCKKLKKFGKKLKCIKSSSLKRAKRCVKALTKPLRQTLTEMYLHNKTKSHDARRLACIISAATATCYKEKMRSCRSYLRDYIGAYHVILGGKCLSVLKTSGEFVDDSIIMPRQADRNWMSIVQSILKDVGINQFPKSLLPEIQTTISVSSQKIQSMATSSFEIQSTTTSSHEIQSITSTSPQEIQSMTTTSSQDIQSTSTSSSQEIRSNTNSSSAPLTTSFADGNGDSRVNSKHSNTDEQTIHNSEEKESTQNTTTELELFLTTTNLRPTENGDNSLESKQKSGSQKSTTFSDESNVNNSKDKITPDDSVNYTLSTDSSVSKVTKLWTPASSFSSMRSSSSTQYLSSLSLGSLILSVMSMLIFEFKCICVF